MGSKTNNEKGVPYGARSRMPLWYGIAWSTRGVSAAFNVMVCMNVAFYCTDIIGLDATIVGTLFLVSKIIDAFTDLGFGYILDKTHTRWGKARPYEVFIIIEWLFTVLMFSMPNVGTMVQYIWLFVTYTVINAVCNTALGGVDSVYMARAFATEDNRIKAMSINGFVVMFFGLIFGIIFPRWLAGAGTTKSAWTVMAISLGIVMSVIGIMRFVFCKEIVEDEPKEGNKKVTNSLNLKDSLTLVAKNKYLYIVVGLMLLSFVVNNMGTATTYYFKYIMGDIGKQSTAATTSLVIVPALIFFPVLAKKFGTSKILQTCCAIGLAGILVRTIGGPNMVTIIIGSVCFSIGTMPINMMINTYLIDCMDYGEWKTGVRVEGLVASIANFASKVGSGVAVALVGLVTGLAGYDGLAATQSATANGAIVFLYNWLPLIFFVVMLLLSLMYKIDSIRPQMNEDLAKLRDKAKEGQ